MVKKNMPADRIRPLYTKIYEILRSVLPVNLEQALLISPSNWRTVKSWQCPVAESRPFSLQSGMKNSHSMHFGLRSFGSHASTFLEYLGQRKSPDTIPWILHRISLLILTFTPLAQLLQLPACFIRTPISMTRTRSACPQLTYKRGAYHFTLYQYD